MGDIELLMPKDKRDWRTTGGQSHGHFKL
jgi:hypothetical protein